MNNKKLDRLDCAKFLGVFIDTKLQFDHYINYIQIQKFIHETIQRRLYKHKGQLQVTGIVIKPRDLAKKKL